MRPLNILLIEPDALLAKMYTQALVLADYRVQTAQTAQTAVDAADAQLPDVIVLEVQLSAHNGVEFLYELRSYTEWQNIPVIINSYTSPSAFDTVRQALKKDLGVVNVLYKPRTSLQQLVHAVREAVGQLE